MRRNIGYLGNFAILAVSMALLAFQLDGCRIAPDNGRLDLEVQNKPYTLDQSFGIELPPEENGFMGFVMCDIDGDGIKEFVEGQNQKFLGYDSEDGPIKPRWEMHLGDPYFMENVDVAFGTSHDFNRDNVEEIYFTAVSKDQKSWRFVVLDPASESFLLNTPLPVGEDRRPPANWDGSYLAKGIVEDADGAGNPGVVLVRCAGYDATLRGICAVSPTTGELIWEYTSGAQPMNRSVVVEDLDGDGNREISWVTSAPDNLDGRLINGTSDDRSYLIVLDHRGQPLLVENLSTALSSGSLQVQDLDADGIKEIITYTSNTGAGGNNQLAVWDWQERRILASVRRVSYFHGLAIVPGPRPDTHWLIAGSNNGSLSRYLYENGKLVMDRTVLQDEAFLEVLGQGDFLPAKGQEIFLNVGTEGLLVAVGPSLEPLGIFSGDLDGLMGGMDLWQRQPGVTTLVAGNSRGQWVFDYRKNPNALYPTLVKAGLVLLGVLALLGMFLLGRSKGRRDDRAHGEVVQRQVGADRQALFLLYRELADVNHQIVGHAKGLARLLWLLEAYSSELAPSSELELRIGQVLLDFRETVHPILAGILQSAGAAGFEAESVRATSPVLDSLAQRINGLVEPKLEPSRIAAEREELSREWAQVKAGFLNLHNSITDYFTTDPVRMIRGMILVRAEEFERAGITAEFIGTEDHQMAHLALVDSGDLRFVLDNLLDNAIRAMKEMDNGKLVVQLAGQEQEIALHITDTGNGIEPHLHEAIFSRRFSSRQGGGQGLFRSREILERWGGEIMLADSRPGKGTTFIVKLLAATDRDSSRSMQARG